jgi:hypothetical protein
VKRRRAQYNRPGGSREKTIFLVGVVVLVVVSHDDSRYK